MSTRGPIRSFVFYLLSCNLSELITVGIASAINAPLPILPMQILFLNLVTDVFNMVSPRSGFVFNEVTRNPWIWGAIILCTGLLIAAVYVPILSEVLGTVEPGREGWMLVLTLSFAPVLVGQSLRAVGQVRRKYGRQA
jgi:magnesium-transporting ATPase (P-type)